LALAVALIVGPGFGRPAPAIDPEALDLPIRPVHPSDDFKQLRQSGAVVLDSHVLTARAALALRGASPAFATAFERIEERQGRPPTYTEENARLTARQLMPIYLQEAGEYYNGTRQRGTGVVARRQAHKTDLELGDEQLGFVRKPLTAYQA
jgi:hypothetical protein